MMMRRKKKRSIAFLLVCALLLVGCSSGTSGETDAIKAAKQKVQALGKEPKLIATSPAGSGGSVLNFCFHDSRAV